MSFEAFSGGQRTQLLQERTSRLTSTPMGRFCYVSVTFPAINTDVAIPQTIGSGIDPEGIRWIPVSQDFVGSVFRGGGMTQRAFTTDTIYLQSSAIGTARLLIFVEA